MANSIPHVIHYFWFGGAPLGKNEEACINSWKTYCPDYEIKCWDETNFDVNQNRYCREAHESKKWAFVSDYARLWVLVNYGGIYMDTDVEVVKPLDEFLVHAAFSGFESTNALMTGLMACRSGFPLFEKLLHSYDERAFVSDDGTIDTTTNVTAVTDACLKRGLIPNNTYQVIDGFAIYPNDWFSPKSYQTGLIYTTDNTHAIHHFAGSWVSEADKTVHEMEQSMLRHHPDMDVKAAERLAKLQYTVSHGDLTYVKRVLKKVRPKKA